MAYYYIKKIGFLTLYIFTAIKTWIYVFGPAVALYGFWPFVGTVLPFTVIINIASFGFFFTRKSRYENATQ
jgi:hypothetical protein